MRFDLELNNKYNSDWLSKPGKRAIISGPCSAESEEQMLDTARKIAALFPDNIFRAGSWKPRTRPGQFEGKGEDALKWFSLVKQETGMKTTTEVAVPKHVEQSLSHGIDILWIGARTTVNPFMVQEIAEALKGVDIPVMVKNPLHPDLQLWVGGMERLQKSGVTRLAAIHRGFYTFEHSEYRNAPRWEIVYELKSLLPEMPVICDISHIAGSTGLLQMVAQQAMDLSLDGLMIETHNNPSVALSDAKQQITPEELNELIKSLKFRNPSFTEEVIKNHMNNIRLRIDELDKLLMQHLGSRMELAREIAELKKEHNVSILQMQRWKEVMEQCMLKADEMGLHREFIRNIFIQIHDESIRLQSAILTESIKKPAGA